MTYALIAFGVACALIAFAVITAWNWIFVVGIALGIVGLASVFITADREEREAWALFAAEHSCRVVGKQSGTTSIMVLPNTTSGTTLIPITSPGKTGYACDDGVTYWR